MATYSGYKHLVVVKFKDGTNVDEIVKGLENVAYTIDFIKSFEWGENHESDEVLRQGFTHTVSLTFENKAGYDSFDKHPLKIEYQAVLDKVIEKIVILNHNVVVVKSPVVV